MRERGMQNNGERSVGGGGGSDGGSVGGCRGPAKGPGQLPDALQTTTHMGTLGPFQVPGPAPCKVLLIRTLASLQVLSLDSLGIVAARDDLSYNAGISKGFPSLQFSSRLEMRMLHEATFGDTC